MHACKDPVSRSNSCGDTSPASISTSSTSAVPLEDDVESWGWNVEEEQLFVNEVEQPDRIVGFFDEQPRPIGLFDLRS